jgi:hypothetical protein
MNVRDSSATSRVYDRYMFTDENSIRNDKENGMIIAAVDSAPDSMTVVRAFRCSNAPAKMVMLDTVDRP